MLSACIVIAAGLVAACSSSGTTPQPQQAATPSEAPGGQVAVPQSTAPSVSTPQPPTAEPFVATVNGEPIPLSTYENQVAQFQSALIAQGLDPNSAEGQAQLGEVKDRVLNGMIDQVLIEQEARRKGVGISDAEFEQAMNDIISTTGGQEAFAAQLAAVGQSEEDFRAGQRAAMLASLIRDQVISAVSANAPQVHARHILVDNADLANSLLAQLQAGADFTSLAQQYSQDTLTRDGGGDLGWFPRGVLISREVEDAAFALQPGQYSGVVQSAFGFHIVQVIEAEPSRPLTPDQLLSVQQITFEQWLASLRAAANIVR
jgi:parvulin-like peptidyl-prolyl isomerase